MKQLHPVILFAIALVFAQNCTQNTKNAASKATVITATDPKIAPITLPLGFNDYWYAGNAELCTYSVSQERYGEIRQAEQINIVVTEDFSDARQVKLDDPAAAGIDRIPVLKFNSIRRFHTGIYDYSIMQSPPTLSRPRFKLPFILFPCGTSKHSIVHNKKKKKPIWHTPLP